MKLLDLMCKAGGASVGYSKAGFEVTGVDHKPQKNYPFNFKQADVFELPPSFFRQFDAIHASPDCQGYSVMRHAPGAIGAPRLIGRVRTLLKKTGKPYIIENVEAARPYMIDPIMLCGTMFGLGAEGCELQRHRLFETSFPIPKYPNCQHTGGPVIGVYGGHARCRAASYGGRGTKDIWEKGHKGAASTAMRIYHMNLMELSEALPPAYCHWIGTQLKEHLNAKDLQLA